MAASIKLGLIGFITMAVSLTVRAAETPAWHFIQNMGQWDSNIWFQASVPGGVLYMEENGFTWDFADYSDLHAVKEGHLNAADAVVKGHVYKANFQHTSSNVSCSASDKQATYYNYFIGNNPDKWKGAVPAFGMLEYKNLYDGIDMQVYTQSGNLKYDLIVAPGISTEQIVLQYNGMESIQITDGQLHILTNVNRVVEKAPIAFQEINGQRKYVNCHYALEGNALHFVFPDGYNTDYTLVIDPSALIFCSYSGSSSDNWGYSATYDNDGSLYGAGIAFGSGYPTVAGSYQVSFAGGEGSFPCDVAISKFTPDGSDLVYSTFLGGSHSELPHSMVVDSLGELVVYGTTGSDDFPVSADAYDDSFGGGTNETVTYVITFNEGSDVFVTKFNAAGSALVGSTYIGGSQNDGLNTAATLYNYGDHARGEVITDAGGEVYIASCTKSNDIPAGAGTFQPSLSGGQDGFIAHLTPDLSDLVWCSYLGGTNSDGAYSIKKAPDGSFLVCGGTISTDFPIPAGGLNPAFLGGTMDGFLVRISADASDIMAGSFIGTNAYDQTFLLEVDDDNAVYVTGQTLGTYPVTAGVYNNPGSTQYLTKLNEDLSEIIYSTVFGSGSSNVNISPTALLVDACESVYVAGWGGTTNSGFNPATGNVSGMPVTPDAFSTSTSGSDFYFIVFKKDLTDLLYATFFGSPSAADHVDGGTSRFDRKGTIYQAVCAGCGGFDDFPTTDGSWSEVNNSTNCNLGVIKYEFIYLGPTSLFEIEPAIAGCAPLSADLINNSLNAEFYYWDFGDGTSSTDENPSHVYTTPGEYTVSLTAEDPESCLPFDTVYATVYVYGYPVAAFTPVPSPFSPIAYDFEDNSIDAATWYWTFGDGSSSTEQNPFHVYTNPGTYEVCQVVETSFGCQDSICQLITIEAVSQLDVPNAFSPNGDGINDFFLPFNFSLVAFEMRIYNRWGELVFVTTDTSSGWDGTYNGKDQEMDTYVYTINASGEDGADYFFKGNITLVR